MNDNVTLIFHGFLNLSNLEKLELVESINEYFDSNEKETIREINEGAFAKLDLTASDRACKCCGR